MKNKGVVKNSAMRFSLVVISLGIFMMLLVIGFYVVWETIEGSEVSWTELGVFAGGLAALMTGSGWNKTKQKEIEVQEENEKE